MLSLIKYFDELFPSFTQVYKDEPAGYSINSYPIGSKWVSTTDNGDLEIGISLPGIGIENIRIDVEDKAARESLLSVFVRDKLLYSYYINRSTYNTDSIEAVYKDGILTLCVRKVELKTVSKRSVSITT